MMSRPRCIIEQPEFPTQPNFYQSAVDVIFHGYPECGTANFHSNRPLRSPKLLELKQYRGFNLILTVDILKTCLLAVLPPRQMKGNLIDNATQTLHSSTFAVATTACISAACLFHRPDRLRSRLSWANTYCPLAPFPFRCTFISPTPQTFQCVGCESTPQLLRPTAVKQLEALSRGRNS